MNRNLALAAALALSAGSPTAIGESILLGRRDPDPAPRLSSGGGPRVRGEGRAQPAGTKNLRRWFKAKHGHKGSRARAEAWYAGYLAEKDAKVRAADREKRVARILRNHPWLAEWPTVKAAEEESARQN